jgi:group II intron reverse transcriptase/maturase
MKAEMGNPTSGEEAERNSVESTTRAESTVAARTRTKAEPRWHEVPALMEVVVERDNMKRAYNRVVRNKGSAGVDGLGVSELKAHLQRHWPTIKAKLLEGRYQPQPVRRVSLPKPDGGERHLGIPTVVDRLIQQALHQVLSPVFEPTFSEHSYGFRPGRSAHQAVLVAQSYVADGHQWVVDIDLEQFFDRVNHDLLMSRVSRWVADRRILRLIRRYLEAGIMIDGLTSPRREGTPQGGPLSPLLSNILLTDLDRELERRGHAFIRYADDVVIYVKSERAGQRVLESLKRFVGTHLKLKVSDKKSAVVRPSQSAFLGYSLSGQGQLRIAMRSRQRLLARLRQLFRGARGRSLRYTIDQLNPILRGWAAYFRLTDTSRPLEVIDGWVRRKLRCILWRQWKRPHTRARSLMRLGLCEERAWRSATNGRGPWWNAGSSHMNAALTTQVFDRLGLVSVLQTVRRLQRVL